MEYFAILTLHLTSGSGAVRFMESRAIVKVPAGATRAGIYDQMVGMITIKHGPEWADAVPLFFSAEPNDLP